MAPHVRGRRLAWLGAVLLPATAHAQPIPSVPPTATPSPAAPAPVPVPAPTGAHLHDGFYFRYSLGLAYVWMSGNGPSGSVTARGGGVGETIAVGGTPAEGLVIAAAAMFHDAKTDSVGGVSQTSAFGSPVADSVPGAPGFGSLVAGTYGVLVDWFPDPAAGWHVGGGLGVALVGFAFGRGTSAGASVVGGYDFWVAPQWSLGAMAVATSSLAAAQQDGGAPGYRFAPTTVAFEASVLCH